jgi:hypothetical protein
MFTFATTYKPNWKVSMYSMVNDAMAQVAEVLFLISEQMPISRQSIVHAYRLVRKTFRRPTRLVRPIPARLLTSWGCQRASIFIRKRLTARLSVPTLSAKAWLVGIPASSKKYVEKPSTNCTPVTCWQM